ncbi:gas vesicle protein [Streptomyces sp. 8L]|uniref:gas vesicle protein n=1 Tax=Streptomyces sp. 8L TaxID=2877242 RepID=UPI0035A88CDF
MSDSLAGRMGGSPVGTPYGSPAQGSSANLADILERVLDKGVVIAGDIQINLLDIELLTIKLRLLVASVDKAKEMGIDWWEHDPSLSSRARDEGPGRQMSAGHRGGRAQAAVPGPGGEEQSDEIARLRAEVAELRAAAGGAALPRGRGTEGGDRAPQREPAGGREADREPRTDSVPEPERPRKRPRPRRDTGDDSNRTERTERTSRSERADGGARRAGHAPEQEDGEER